MGNLYLIPDYNNTETSVNLIKKYDGFFEYNDFWHPEILDDICKQEEIIEHYAGFRNDFSRDTMHGAFLDVSVHSEDPLIREISEKRVFQSMEIAKRMGLRGVVFHTGLLAGCRMERYLKHWEESNIDFYGRLADKYPEQEILIENMFDETPDEIGRLAEALKKTGNIGICFDYAHGVLTGCAQENWVRELAPYIRHIHINDNDLYCDQHKPLGQGMIDWQKFSSLMQLYSVESSVLVEVNGYENQKQSLEYMNSKCIYPFKNINEV